MQNPNKSLLNFTLILAMSLIPSSLLRANDLTQPGAPAPRISAPDQDGNPLDLGALYDQGTTLVYFYPKADTPGCTAQACGLRDAISELKDLGIQVVGVSKDTPAAQKKFQAKYELPFPLIADYEGKVAEAFGVGSMLGFTSRSSFLIQDGKVVWAQPKAQTAGHAAEVKAALAALPKSS